VIAAGRCSVPRRRFDGDRGRPDARSPPVYSAAHRRGGTTSQKNLAEEVKTPEEFGPSCRTSRTATSRVSGSRSPDADRATGTGSFLCRLTWSSGILFPLVYAPPGRSNKEKSHPCVFHSRSGSQPPSR